MNKKFNQEVSKAKKRYYKDFVKDLRVSKVSQWYSKLKRLCSYDQHKADPVIVESIKNLTDKEQAELIAAKFARVSQEYEPLKKEDISIPPYEKSTIPVFKPCQVQQHLKQVKVNKSVPPGDIPTKLIRLFAAEMSIPLCSIINSSVQSGAWAKLYKSESVTPVPKIFLPKSIEDLRNISGLLTFNKIAEKMIAEVMISDMAEKLDPLSVCQPEGTVSPTLSDKND